MLETLAWEMMVCFWIGVVAIAIAGYISDRIKQRERKLKTFNANDDVKGWFVRGLGTSEPRKGATKEGLVMDIKMTAYIYQGIGPYNRGQVTAEWFKRDAKTCDMLDCMLIEEKEIEISAEPVEMDCELARKQLKKRAIEEERDKLQEQLDKLNAA